MCMPSVPVSSVTIPPARRERDCKFIRFLQTKWNVSRLNKHTNPHRSNQMVRAMDLATDPVQRWLSRLAPPIATATQHNLTRGPDPLQDAMLPALFRVFLSREKKHTPFRASTSHTSYARWPSVTSTSNVLHSSLNIFVKRLLIFYINFNYLFH
jgi:hypothetical protein